MASDIEVQPITNADDVITAFDVVYTCFCVQTYDGIMQAMNPGAETVEGRRKAAERMADRWRGIKEDKFGNPTTIFLKATVPDPKSPHSEDRKIVGFAIWVQMSAVEGHGEPVVDDLSTVMNLEDLYPGDVSEQQFLSQLLGALGRQRRELVRAKVNCDQPAVMGLDLCAVHPDFQRRGIARRMVQYGLDEAKSRGNMVCCLEASVMGRPVYAKMGFTQEGHSIVYGVEAANFAKKGMPDNIFMRTADVV